MENQISYTPSHIANFFLKKKDHEITNLKLNKLVYVSLGYSLAVLDRDLFEEEVQAWKYGPVIPSLYFEFKHFGRFLIDKKSNEYLYDAGEIAYPKIYDKQDKMLIDLLDLVWDTYQSKSGGDLIELTHADNTPWDVHYIPQKNNNIERSTIKDYYTAFLDLEECFDT